MSVLRAGADHLRMHQALAAVVDNAVRHRPDDSSIHVAAARSDGHVELSVTDSGPGLTTTEAADVFGRFGSGREFGHGATFTIVLPIAHEDVAGRAVSCRSICCESGAREGLGCSV